MTGPWVLITGGTGTIGRGLALWHIQRETRVRILSRNESSQFELRTQFEHLGISPERYRFFVGDVRDRDRLRRACDGVIGVYHAAAMKHVDACEYNPSEAIKTNIGGIENLIECASGVGVKFVVNMSSDKAADPSNLMGVTKLAGERLITQANAYGRGCKFMSVRFGNVLGSRGSVVPLWRKQLSESGIISITDPEVTRFVMSVGMAVNLCVQASDGLGGEIFLTQMPVIKLINLAHVLISEFERLHDVKGSTQVKHIGLRPGETREEIIITQEEAPRTVRTRDGYVILPNIMFTHINYDDKYRGLDRLTCEILSDSLGSRDEAGTRKLLQDWEI